MQWNLTVSTDGLDQDAWYSVCVDVDGYGPAKMVTDSGFRLYTSSVDLVTPSPATHAILTVL